LKISAILDKKNKSRCYKNPFFNFLRVYGLRLVTSVLGKCGFQTQKKLEAKANKYCFTEVSLVKGLKKPKYPGAHLFSAIG